MFLARRILPLAAVVGLLFSSPSYADGLASSAVVYLRSDPGSWVGGAIAAPEVTWRHGIDGLFSVRPNYNGDYRSGIEISYNDGAFWSFDFAAPTYDPATNTNDGQPLAVGLYQHAQRFPFNSPTKPGLSVSGNGRGNNTLSGWFDVRELTYDVNGGVERFAVDFRQFDESANETGPSLYGSLRFNSAIPINAVPEPGTYLMLVAGLGVLGASFARRKSRT